MKKHSVKRSFYTLIEILTVVVIAAIIFAIGIPAFTTMIQGNTMTIAVRQFSSKVSAARAYAISNKCRVALLLVENEDFLGDGGRYSAYRVCLVDDSNKFDSWIGGEDWKTLPEGILRYEGGAGSVNGNLEPVTDVPVLKGDGTPDSNQTFKAVIFKKDGQAVNSNDVQIRLTRGRCVAGTLHYTDRDPSNNAKKGLQSMSVNRLTGKVTTGEFKYN